jgi:hypothetical protein
LDTAKFLRIHATDYFWPGHLPRPDSQRKSKLALSGQP